MRRASPRVNAASISTASRAPVIRVEFTKKPSGEPVMTCNSNLAGLAAGRAPSTVSEARTANAVFMATPGRLGCRSVVLVVSFGTRHQKDTMGRAKTVPAYNVYSQDCPTRTVLDIVADKWTSLL